MEDYIKLQFLIIKKKNVNCAFQRLYTMTELEQMNHERKYIKRFFVGFLIALSSLIISSLLWNIKEELHSAQEYASKEAHGAYNKDLLYRRWGSMHGGVYVPITNITPPNPHLEFLPQRDIISETGMRLTLVNPAYMTRQVYELAEKQYGIKGHITSLNPLRPENIADEWETKALKSFENGGTEARSVENIYGDKYLRLMVPMLVEQSCLKCHAPQGYKVGDIRGGISVSIPMDEYLETAYIQIKYLILTHSLTFLIIFLIGWFSYKRFITEIEKQNLMQNKLVESEAGLKIQNKEYSKLNKNYIKLNKKLTEALEKATESDRLKSAFLANMSHEIRTPMNGILGFTTLLKEPDTSVEEQKQFVEIINKSSLRLLDTINDIIEISKIESGLEKFNINEVDIIQELNDLYEFFIIESKQKGIELILHNPKITSDVKFYTDKKKVQSILTNLIKNAIKFTNEGNITISCEIQTEHMALQIADTGIGIEKERQKAIFDRFEQADQGHTRSYEGSGLGLSICKSYAELIGGKIWLESEVNIGTKFFIDIPNHKKR